MKKVPSAIVLFLILLLIFGVGLISAQDKVPIDQIQPADLVIDEPVPSLAEQRETIAYWTRERNLALPEMPVPFDYSNQSLDNNEIDFIDSLSDPPGSSAPGAPMSNADLIAQAEYPEEWAALENDEELEIANEELYYQLDESIAPDALDGSGGIFTAYFVKTSSDTRVYPHKWVGRVASSGGSCSGTVISNNHLLTAAHCVYNTVNNTWYGSKAFQPAYRAGGVPYGVFPTTGCTILTKYKDLSGKYTIIGWARYDVAVCNLGRNKAGYTVNQMVGWAGREWNTSSKRHIYQLGYPGRDYKDLPIKESGKYLHLCIAESFWQWTDVRGIGCDMGGGKSGGPWMTNYYWRKVSGYVTGVQSGIYVNTPNSYGPRFSSSNIVPLCNHQGC